VVNNELLYCMKSTDILLKHGRQTQIPIILNF
jgi:hypothetical protein